MEVDNSPETQRPLINPEYEKEVKLKVDLAKKIYVNCIRKHFFGTPNTPASARITAIHYSGIPESIYPNPVQKIFEVPNIKIIKPKIRPIIQEIIEDQYVNKQVLPVLKHLDISHELWQSAILKNEISKTQLSILLHEDNLPVLMKKLGYKWQRLPSTEKKFIIESPEYVNARYKYLKTIIKYREELRDILYLDIVNIKEKLLRETDYSCDITNYRILTISPKNGVLSNTVIRIRDKPITEILESLVTETLLRVTSPNSAIILGDDDNMLKEPSHCRKKWPNRVHMESWLEEKGIPFTENMHRCELFDLVQKYSCKSPYKQKWENLLTASGRVVLKRPKWMQDFGVLYEWSPKKMKDQPNTNNLSKGLKISAIDKELQYNWLHLDKMIINKELITMGTDKYIEDLIETVMLMVKENGLLAEDLALNEFDDVSSSDDDD